MIAENAYGHGKRLAWIVSRTRRGDRLIEVGCGTGLMITLPLARLGYRIVGVDPDEASVAAGRALFRREGVPPDRLRTATLAAVAEPADVIIASEVLEHLPDDELEAVLRTAYGKLPPGGRLLVTVPNGYGWFELESFLWFRLGVGRVVERLGIDRAIRKAKRLLFRWRPEDDETPASLSTSPHIQRFTHRSIRTRLRRAGFEVTEITGTVLFAGPFSNLFFTGIAPLMRLNCALGAWLPRVAAGFLVACRRAEPQADELLVLKLARTSTASPAGARAVAHGELVRAVKRACVVGHLGRYRRSRLRTYRLDVMPRPLATALLLRLVTRGACVMEDERGACLVVGVRTLGRLAGRFVRDLRRRPLVLRRVRREVAALARGASAPRPAPRLDLAASPVYVRTDLAFGVESGGSVGHVAGVLNHLDRFTGHPVFLTTDAIPTVRRDIETHVVPVGDAFWDFEEMPAISLTGAFEPQARRHLDARPVAFVYQRYSLATYVGLLLARRYHVPFVLEYNGSEVWVARHWAGSRLRYETLSAEIESVNLRAADLVVVVSHALADELVSKGVPPQRILVNPNGVDPDRYSPAVDGAAARRRLGLDGKLVIGFIGTFGPWHGAEVLAEAFGRLLAARRADREAVRLLMVGDGARMAQVREVLARLDVADACVLTGMVPQEDGPAHLAACDVLVSPHVPNPDGTRFFGSPTKLFEYMAMGRGIVASRLEQIGEVLVHDETAWLVRPGDPNDLAAGLRTLLDDERRRVRLGAAARTAVLARHTWLEHTRRIVEALKGRCA